MHKGGIAVRLLCRGQVDIYALHGPVINVGYGRPDVNKSDEFGGVGSNTNDQRDYPAAELIAEWGAGPRHTQPANAGRGHAAALRSRQYNVWGTPCGTVCLATNVKYTHWQAHFPLYNILT